MDIRPLPAMEEAYALELLAAIVSSSDDAIISKNLDGIITSWNAGAERIFGYMPQEMIGQSVLKLIPPELRGEEAEILAQVKAGARVEHYETVRLTRAGARVHVSLTVSPVKGPSGKVIGASKIARDISDRITADRNSAVLAAIVQSSDDAIISKDLTGIITSWNPAAERLYGFTAGEMVGSSIMKIVPTHLVGEEERILAQIRSGEKLDHYETTRLTKTGGTVEVFITVSPIRDHDGRVVGASKIARDMSAQREAQRRKDLFLAVLAHELRNPLAPIRNAVALMKHESLSEQQRQRALLMAERQTTHMARLLDDLLDISRLSTGKVELKRERMDLRVTADQAVESVRPMLLGRHHTLSLENEGDPLWMQADPVRILQILSNLLSNAVKYTDPHGRIGVTVAREGGEAVVSVTDTGIGFSEQTRAHLFTLFAQAEGVGALSAGGLGIGLALTREFVERHGGTVQGESAGPGLGSRFTVRLPLERA